MRALAAGAGALVLLAFVAPARADEPAGQATTIAHAAVTASARPMTRAPVRVVVSDAHDATGSVDLRAVISEASPAPSTPEVRVDGALFAGLVTAGLVVAERPGSEAAAPRPVAGLSPRLLRGGGVACDVRVSF